MNRFQRWIAPKILQSSLFRNFTGIDARDPRAALMFGVGNRSKAGVNVDEEDALGISAYYACVNLIANTIGSLPLTLRRISRPGGPDVPAQYTDAFSHPLHDALLRQPNASQTADEWKRLSVWHLKLHGNHYSRVQTDPRTGQCMALEPFSPTRVTPFWHRGMRAYRITKDSGADEILLQGEVLHIMDTPTMDGLRGRTPLEVHRETYGLDIALRDHGSIIFKNNAMPHGLLSTDWKLSPETSKKMEKDWKENYGGTRRGGVAVLEEGLKFDPLGMSMVDAQWMQARNMSDLEVCRILGVPPYKVGIYEKSTFNNVEHQNRAFSTDTIQPLTNRYTECIVRDCMTTNNRRSLVPIWDLDKLLAGDSKTQAEVHKLHREMGLKNANEIRAERGENPIGDAGDVYTIPMNFGDMSRVTDDLWYRKARTQSQPPAPKVKEGEDDEEAEE